MAKVGRPTKLTENLLNKLEEVSSNAIYLTDEDLVFLLNEQLEEKEQISLSSFQSYKQSRRQETSPLIVEFVRLIKNALLKEKQELLKLVKVGDNGWQSKSWILERKFKEWNLKQFSETDLSNKDGTLNNKMQIVVETEQQKKDIEDVLNEV